VVRKKSLQGQVAPSTSILIKGLLNTDACMDVQMIASTLSNKGNFDRLAQTTLNVPQSSGYAPCLRVGDLVFIAGQLARDNSGQIAASAKVPEGQLWNGTRIQLETEYLIQHRLIPALEAAHSSLNLVLKAQVYLSHNTDLAQFWQVWAKAFGDHIPPTTVVPVAHPGFGTEEATIEINLIAAHQDAAKDIKDIHCEVELIGKHMVPAKSFQNLLFVAGLMAVEDGGLCESSKPSASSPYYINRAYQQGLNILDKAKKIFKAAQTDLSYITRAIHFQSNLNEFNSIYQAWDPELRRAGLPFTAIDVGSELFVKDASLILDLWGYIPR
jgi:enamine deaminase RidA (YjgF/YER057c/UK114 family)